MVDEVVGAVAASSHYNQSTTKGDKKKKTTIPSMSIQMENIWE